MTECARDSGLAEKKGPFNKLRAGSSSALSAVASLRTTSNSRSFDSGGRASLAQDDTMKDKSKSPGG